MTVVACVLGFAALLWGTEQTTERRRGSWRWMALGSAAFVWGLTGLLLDHGVLTDWARAAVSLGAAVLTARVGREMSAAAPEPAHRP